MGFFRDLITEHKIEEFKRFNRQLLNAFNKSFSQQFGISMNIQMSVARARTFEYDDEYDDNYIEIKFDVRNQRALVFFTTYEKYNSDKYNGYLKGNNIQNFVT